MKKEGGLIRKWFIGVDGGGTKTEITIADSKYNPVATTVYTGCSYQSLGVVNAVEVVYQSIIECMALAGIEMDACAACCIGMPCYGENREKDKEILTLLQSKFNSLPLYVTNDVEIGWAGASGCKPGIHIVSGTGSIAFGCDERKKTVRCGGWHEFFGDEGSCYWIGRETMSLFSKEADGRLPKGALYEIIRSELGVENDFQFVDWVIKNVMPFRDQVARFQRYTLQAALEEDVAAIELYERAAKELMILVRAVQTQLEFPNNDKTSVTYSGGLFHAEEMITKPLEKELQLINCKLSCPQYPASIGAVMLAKYYLNNEEEKRTCI